MIQGYKWIVRLIASGQGAGGEQRESSSPNFASLSEVELGELPDSRGRVVQPTARQNCPMKLQLTQRDIIEVRKWTPWVFQGNHCFLVG